LRPGPFDEPEYGERAEAALGKFRSEETIYRGHAVAQPVGEAGAHETVLGVAELDHHGFDRRVFHHGAVVVEAHCRHVAFAVAGLLVALEQGELLGRGARRHLEPLDQRIGAGHPLQSAVDLEIPRRDPDRHAGGTGRADRGVGDIMAAPESGAGQPVVQRIGFRPGDFGHDFPLDPPLHIRAG
jgi:hypothetical protein